MPKGIGYGPSSTVGVTKRATRKKRKPAIVSGIGKGLRKRGLRDMIGR